MYISNHAIVRIRMIFLQGLLNKKLEHTRLTYSVWPLKIGHRDFWPFSDTIAPIVCHVAQLQLQRCSNGHDEHF